MSGQPFSRTTVWVVIGVALASLIGAVVLTVFGGDLRDQASAGADAYSKSAIGHRGLVEILRRLDIPVVISRDGSAAKAEHGLLIVAEPSLADPGAEARLGALADAAPRVLVVLPKWYGLGARGEPWIDFAGELDAANADRVLDALHVRGTTSRVTGVSRWATAGASPSLPDPQLIAASDLTATTSHAGGILVGSIEREGRQLWIVSDPDVLNNAGLRVADNARFAVELIDTLRAGGPVVFDETAHGHGESPSMVRALFRFPLVLAMIQIVCCALLAVWAALMRFGPARVAPPPLAAGKDFLIRNTAALLGYGGHHGYMLRRYLSLTVQAVRHALHAPALAPAATTAWLERVRATRGGTISLVDLERAAQTAETPQRIAELCDQIYRWRMEMTHGTQHRS